MKSKWLILLLVTLAVFGFGMSGCRSGEPGDGDTFTPYPFPASVFTANGLKAELEWNDDSVLPKIKESKDGSYFEIIFEKEIATSDSIGDLATYLNVVADSGTADDYQGAKSVYPDLNGESSYEVSIEQVIEDMIASFSAYPITKATISKSGLGGLAVQIFSDKADGNKLKSITFYSKD
jgi:hypothetical protein